ncbi:MAG: serine dehydratase, partial [Bacteroidales bacterium]|nr:serine dehydratase [Bacteroidales bacterium]
MKSLKQLYKIGRGPSSSHTMGPQKAAQKFLAGHPDAAGFEVTLYGSLAATGKGHLTDVAILDVLTPAAPTEILWKADTFLPFHPNGMKFVSKDADGNVTDEWTCYSVGGGSLAEESADGSIGDISPDIYDLNTLQEILDWCDENGRAFWEYVDLCEDKDIWDYLQSIWDAMKASIVNGLENEGALPGPLHLAR